MYSLSSSLVIATTVFCVWTAVFFEAVQSFPTGQDPRSDEHGSGSVQCEKKTDSDLIKLFAGENEGREDVYLQKFLIGNKTVHAGSFTNIHNDCVKDLIMDYDSQRFPQYLIHTTCETSSKCTEGTDKISPLNLTSIQLCEDGTNQAKVVLSVCLESS